MVEVNVFYTYFKYKIMIYKSDLTYDYRYVEQATNTLK